jgi:hypothetical protein
MSLKSPYRILSFVFSIVFFSYFIFYSIQPYFPRSIQRSSLYSIVDCPSHSIQSSLANMVRRIAKPGKNEGTEKHCFCFPRISHNSESIVFKSSTDVLVDKYTAYLFPLTDDSYLKDFYTKLSCRSPPVFLI